MACSSRRGMPTNPGRGSDRRRRWTGLCRPTSTLYPRGGWHAAAHRHHWGFVSAVPHGLRVAEGDIRIGTVERGMFYNDMTLRSTAAPLHTVMLDALESGRVEEILRRRWQPGSTGSTTVPAVESAAAPQPRCARSRSRTADRQPGQFAGGDGDEPDGTSAAHAGSPLSTRAGAQTAVAIPGDPGNTLLPRRWRKRRTASQGCNRTSKTAARASRSRCASSAKALSKWNTPWSGSTPASKWSTTRSRGWTCGRRSPAGSRISCCSWAKSSSQISMSGGSTIRARSSSWRRSTSSIWAMCRSVRPAP